MKTFSSENKTIQFKSETKKCEWCNTNQIVVRELKDDNFNFRCQHCSHFNDLDQQFTSIESDYLSFCNTQYLAIQDKYAFGLELTESEYIAQNERELKKQLHCSYHQKFQSNQ